MKQYVIYTLFITILVSLSIASDAQNINQDIEKVSFDPQVVRNEKVFKFSDFGYTNSKGTIAYRVRDRVITVRRLNNVPGQTLTQIIFTARAKGVHHYPRQERLKYKFKLFGQSGTLLYEFEHEFLALCVNYYDIKFEIVPPTEIFDNATSCEIELLNSTDDLFISCEGLYRTHQQRFSANQ